MEMLIEWIACDLLKLDDVKTLVEFSISFGEIASVIHAAGFSQHLEMQRQFLESMH